MKRGYRYALAVMLALFLTGCADDKNAEVPETTSANAALAESGIIEKNAISGEGEVGEAETSETAESTASEEIASMQAPPKWVTVPALPSDACFGTADGAAVPVALEQLEETDNHISMAIDWMREKKLFLPILSAHIDSEMAEQAKQLDGREAFAYGQWAGYARSFYDEDYIYAVSADGLEIFENPTAQPLYVVSFGQGLGDSYGIWAKLENDVLYVNQYYNGYAMPDTNYIMAVDIQTGNILWRSEDQTSDARNFIVKEDVILCAYGFTAEEDYLYQLDKKTGRVVSETKIASMADYLVEQDGKLYVHAYNRDYVFSIN